MDFALNLIISLAITVLAYCTVPVILRIKNGKYEYEKGQKIILTNCIIVCIFFVCVRLSQGAEQIASPTVFLYYYINKAILLKPKEELKEETVTKYNNIEKETIKMSLSDPNEVVIRDRTNEFNVYSEDLRIHKETDKKYCINCGKTIEDTWAFCNYCGNKLK